MRFTYLLQTAALLLTDLIAAEQIVLEDSNHGEDAVKGIKRLNIAIIGALDGNANEDAKANDIATIQAQEQLAHPRPTTSTNPTSPLASALV